MNVFAGVKPAATVALPVQNGDVHLPFLRSLIVSYTKFALPTQSDPFVLKIIISDLSKNTAVHVFSFQSLEEHHNLINIRRKVKC